MTFINPSALFAYEENFYSILKTYSGYGNDFHGATGTAQVNNRIPKELCKSMSASSVKESANGNIDGRAQLNSMEFFVTL